MEEANSPNWWIQPIVGKYSGLANPVLFSFTALLFWFCFAANCFQGFAGALLVPLPSAYPDPY